jgi:hypothetical protein
VVVTMMVVTMSDRPVALAGRVTTEEAERARSGTGELYKALGKGADKFIREQKIQQELLRFAKDAMKRYILISFLLLLLILRLLFILFYLSFLLINSL